MGEFEGGEVCAKPSLAVPGRAWPPLASPGRAWPCLASPGRAWPFLASPGLPKMRDPEKLPVGRRHEAEPSKFLEDFLALGSFGDYVDTTDRCLFQLRFDLLSFFGINS